MTSEQISYSNEAKVELENVNENANVESQCKTSPNDAQQGGHYSDQQNIDAECEKLLRNTKRQVKQMMEEAVTKKFIHEESSSIISLCVAVDACLSHGLRRRALGLFKTNSSTALVRKVSKDCKSAQEVVEMVDSEEKRVQEEQQQQARKQSMANNDSYNSRNNNNQKSPIKQVASNSQVHKRNMWIKCALIEKKLVSIVEYLAENSAKYYEPDALMANYLCAQILSSLLVGPCALEYSHSKTADYYQFEEPSADELLKRHKLSNPIACLCNRQTLSYYHANSIATNHRHIQQQHNPLSRSITDTSKVTGDQVNVSNDSTNKICRLTSDQGSTQSDSIQSSPAKTSELSQDINLKSQIVRPISPLSQSAVVVASKEARRKPLALKTNVKTGTVVTDCHHYSCQDISEHQQVRGYSFRCLSTLSLGPQTANNNNNISNLNNSNSTCMQTHQITGNNNYATCHSNTCTSNSCGNNQEWSLWSPRMLHETLHQNSKSKLLYAKNNVLLETQLQGTMAGYLSLHQTNSDLILKWIPNQMINGSQVVQTCCTGNSSEPDTANTTITNTANVSTEEDVIGRDNGHSSIALESSYLDLVVNLSVSRIVLLHCQFARCSRLSDRSTVNEEPSIVQETTETTDADEMISENDQNKPDQKGNSDKDNQDCGKLNQNLTNFNTEETLILVEADGIQRAPFKFPKGGLRWFLSCLESGLSPDKYLDPAIKPDDNFPDPLQSPPPISGGSDSFLSPSAFHNSNESTSGGPLDVILKRLPSLKRNNRAGKVDNQVSIGHQDNSSSNAALRSDSCDTASLLSDTMSVPTVKSFVYRIVSIQQPDWPLQTPPHSALSVGSSSSGSIITGTQIPLSRQTSGGQTGAHNSGQKFRWSLSRLARFSSRYTNSGGSTSSSIGSCHTDKDKDSITTLENCSLYSNNTNQDSMEQGANEAGDRVADKLDNPSRDLARIEAKLNDLKKSTSDDLLALRTQSLQTLCATMRKQIVARAFYGWLAYCRRSKLIRLHLVKLIKPPEQCHLLEQTTEDDLDKLERHHMGLTQQIWDNLMARRTELSEGQLREQVNRLVYYGGIENDALRRQVWPYLLNHFKFRDSDERRAAKVASIREAYEECGREWIKIERVVKQRDREILAANMAKANGEMRSQASEQLTDSIDANNNQQQLETVQDGSLTGEEQNNDNDDNNSEPVVNGTTPDASTGNSNLISEPKVEADIEEDKQGISGQLERNQRMKRVREAAKKRRKRSVRLESTGSVGSDASITDQFGNNVHRIDKDVQRCDRNFWYFKNIGNLEKLRNIMCTYVWQHLDVGYVQGMCDLAAPFLVIFDDEIMAFSCFSQLMKRMVANFPHGNAMDQHFESLKYLMQVLDPKLFDILQSNGDYTHFYFCYRWLLLDFKRELAYEDVYKVWETIWSARFVATDHFVVFMAFAMVRYYRDIIIENNMDFTDTIKFFNEMAEKHDAKQIIALARDYIVELEAQIRML